MSGRRNGRTSSFDPCSAVGITSCFGGDGGGSGGVVED